MEQLWSPWRSKYIGSFKNKETLDECFVCSAITESDNDKSNLIIARFEHSIVMMNKYPYNNGHLLITPIEHKGKLDDLSKVTRAEIMEVTNICTKVIEEVFHPQGYNVGLNAGAAAGAGLPDHLHFHVVPRWRGDTNFTAVISDYKVINESIIESYDKLTIAFTKYKP